ncbi:conserved hypothetical protein [Ferroglobus placidus DSM 10642]|uniref:Uncharacterized protein n=1 Tax=Ferroglobus placidus (strain DSM 10642 / AEDII12DO) TaxID=589924 RepID=D3S288_FERPA|nr:hypothetical protein [Ferroglobus placidus]ADC66579.1 conserved hypothetical protein [Ferroglobus placidus DSM 10642]
MIEIDLRGKILIVNGVVMLAMLLAALANAWQVLGYLVGLSLSLWLVIGAMRENELGPSAWLGALLFIFWAVCITLIFKYWAEFRGKFPEFTIAGMHPGFFVLFPVM